MDKRPKKNNDKYNGNKSVTENYHLPDRTFSDYFCKVCNSHMNSSQMWDSHIQGKRHQKKVKDITEKPSAKTAVASTPQIPLIEETLLDITQPIVGLKYICEIRKPDLLLGPTYKCFLCRGCFATGDILIEHLGSAKHILAYWKEVEPSSLKPFDNYSKGALENVAYDRAAKLENKYGRGIMQVEFEKQKSVLPPPKSRDSDDDRSPPRKRRADFSDDEDSGDRRSQSYKEHSPPMLPNPSSDYRDNFSSRTEKELLRTHREWEMLERERIDRDRAELELLKNRRDLEIMEKEALERDRAELEFLKNCREMETRKREALERDRARYEQADSSYRRVLSREEQLTRHLNSNNSRPELVQQQPWPNLLPQNQQTSATTSAPSVTCEKKSPTLKDFIEAIKICPASYTIELLEKMGPFEITNDEECQRLYEIAKHIDTNIVKFLMSNLSTDQQKQLFKVIQGNNNN